MDYKTSIRSYGREESCLLLRSLVPDCWPPCAQSRIRVCFVTKSPKTRFAFATLSWSPASPGRATKRAGSTQSNEFHYHGLPQLLKQTGLVSDQRFSFGADLPDEAVHEASAVTQCAHHRNPQKVQGR